jgi:hypothetical protein
VSEDDLPKGAQLNMGSISAEFERLSAVSGLRGLLEEKDRLQETGLTAAVRAEKTHDATKAEVG